MTDTEKKDKIVSIIKEVLRKDGWKPQRDSEPTSREKYFGYLLAYPCKGIKTFWVGRLSYKNTNGVFICAQPSTPRGTKQLTKEGFKLTLLPDWPANWYCKRLISESNIDLAYKDKTLLPILLKNTYPF